jgi:thiamine-phosphate pyrophosphorylase
MLRYAITDRRNTNGGEAARRAALQRQAARLARAGVDLLQLREKDLDAGALAELARDVLRALRENGATRLLIGSRADVALAVGADGVHLTSGPGELTAAQVRLLYAHAAMPAPLVSLSCHSVDQVAWAAAGPPDGRPTHLLFGPVFEKRVGGLVVAQGLGLGALEAACKAAAAVPVLALGGVTERNAEACVAAGASGVAAIRMFDGAAATD